MIPFEGHGCLLMKALALIGASASG